MSATYQEEAAALREVAAWMSNIGPGQYQGTELASDALDYARWMREYATGMASIAPCDATRLNAIAASLDQLTLEGMSYKISDIGAGRMIHAASYLCDLANWLEGRVLRVGYDVALAARVTLATLQRRGGHECV